MRHACRCEIPSARSSSPRHHRSIVLKRRRFEMPDVGTLYRRWRVARLPGGELQIDENEPTLCAAGGEEQFAQFTRIRSGFGLFHRLGLFRRHGLVDRLRLSCALELGEGRLHGWRGSWPRRWRRRRRLRRRLCLCRLAALGDDLGIERPAFRDDRLAVRRREARRVAQHRLRDIEHVARQLQHDRARRGRMRGEFRRDRSARRDVGLVDQPHRQLGVVLHFLRRMRRVQEILVGQHPQQRRPNVDTFAVEIEQSFQARRCREIYHRATPSFANRCFHAR